MPSSFPRRSVVRRRHYAFSARKDRQNKKAPANCNLPELFDFSTHQLSDCKAMPE